MIPKITVPSCKHEYFINIDFIMFSVNSLNSVTKSIKFKSYSNLQPLVLGCYHTTIKRHVIDRIFKLTPIHASLIISFPEFTEITEFLFHLGKTPVSCNQFSKTWEWM